VGSELILSSALSCILVYSTYLSLYTCMYFIHIMANFPPPTSFHRAQGPSVPYLGIVLNELSGVVEALPNYIEGDLINFTKMRRVSSHDSYILIEGNWIYDFSIKLVLVLAANRPFISSQGLLKQMGYRPD